MKDDLEKRAKELAVYIIENRATVRAAAKHFGISKSTVHKDAGVIIGTVNGVLKSGNMVPTQKDHFIFG